MRPFGTLERHNCGRCRVSTKQPSPEIPPCTFGPDSYDSSNPFSLMKRSAIQWWLIEREFLQRKITLKVNRGQCCTLPGRNNLDVGSKQHGREHRRKPGFTGKSPIYHLFLIRGRRFVIWPNYYVCFRAELRLHACHCTCSLVPCNYKLYNGDIWIGKEAMTATPNRQ